MRGGLRTALLAGAVLLSACGGSDGGPDAGDADSPVETTAVESPSSPSATTGPGGVTDVPACELLTIDQLEAALGVPVSEGVDLDQGICSWSQQAGGASVSLALADLGGDDCTGARPPGALVVKGLGETAWWDFVQAEVTVGTVTACALDTMIALTVTGALDEVAARVAAEQLTASVLQRLG